MRQVVLILFAGILILSAPFALASTNIDAGVVVLMIEDDRGTSCSVPIGPTCQLDITFDPSNPGNSTIDTQQRIAYLGVATDVGALAPIPEENVAIQGGSIVVPDPALPIVAELWDEHQPGLGGLTNATVVFDDVGVYARYYGPGPANPTSGSDWHVYGLAYTGGNDTGLHPDYIGPFNAPVTDADTDSYWNSAPLYCSFVQNSSACFDGIRTADAAYRNTTPDTRWGLGWYDLQAATTPADLTPPGGMAPRAWHNATHGTDGTPFDEARAPFVSDALQVKQLHSGSSSPQAPQGHGPTPPVKTQDARTYSVPMHAGPPAIASIVAGAATIGFLLALLGYSRFRAKHEVMQHERRKAILDAIKSNPGVNISELSTMLGVERRTIRHHAILLERWGLLAVQRSPNGTRLYPSESKPPVSKSATDLIIDALRSVPGMTREELQSAISILPKRTRNHALRGLLDKGAVREEPDALGVSRFYLSSRPSHP